MSMFRSPHIIAALLATAGILAGQALVAGPRIAAAAGDCAVNAAEINLDAEESGLLNTINAYRGQQGLPALAADATLSRASLWATNDSAERGFAPKDHVDTLGRDIATRVRDCGYTTYTWTSEINYYGSGSGTTPAAAFEWWKNSPYGHNEAMLDSRVRFAGVARVCSGATCFYTINMGSNAGAAVFPPASPATPALNVPLVRQGATGETVKTIQYLLRHHGAAIDVDGIFGPRTHGAVLNFQRSQGIQVDGIVGPETFGRLFATVRQGNSGDAVRALQSQLASRGADLAVDGIFGPLTAGAVRAYQQQTGLTVDGIVGPQTWSALVSGK
jgi:uncharacterized protein YkwD